VNKTEQSQDELEAQLILWLDKQKGLDCTNLNVEKLLADIHNPYSDSFCQCPLMHGAICRDWKALNSFSWSNRCCDCQNFKVKGKDMSFRCNALHNLEEYAQMIKKIRKE
jgi:hypothetical protein